MKMPPISPRFAALDAPFSVEVAARPLPAPRLLHLNARLAEHLQLPSTDENSISLAEILAGNRAWPGYPARASVYAGHQFGQFVPQLGDGRALLVSEVVGVDGKTYEVQLKGAGPTPYSRFADGRAVLRSSIREYLASEAMHALGIPTTRALSLVHSEQPVRREIIETAAIVCRVAPTFVRFGHFEYFYYQRDHDALRRLADWVIAHHFAELTDRPDRYAAWLDVVVRRTAELIAAWQSVGFCHGVMNTDNFSVLGLTLDYGPFGFIDSFDANHICNHSDDHGRYSLSRQPAIGHWNCVKLLQASLPLLGNSPEAAIEAAQPIADRYPDYYEQAMQRRWRAKLGLVTETEGDSALIDRLLSVLHRSKADFTRIFRGLAEVKRNDHNAPIRIRDEVLDQTSFDAWLADYRSRLQNEPLDDAARATNMNRVNPKYTLRNHLAQRAIERCEAGDSTELECLFRIISNPFAEQMEFDAYAAEPPPEARHIEVSCSS